MKVFSTPLLPISELYKNNSSEVNCQNAIDMKEIEELNQVKDLIENEPLCSPSETSLKIIMEHAQKKLKR